MSVLAVDKRPVSIIGGACGGAYRMELIDSYKLTLGFGKFDLYHIKHYLEIFPKDGRKKKKVKKIFLKMLEM